MAGLENYVRMLLKIDEVVKSQNIRSFVIPTKVGMTTFYEFIKDYYRKFLRQSRTTFILQKLVLHFIMEAGIIPKHVLRLIRTRGDHYED